MNQSTGTRTTQAGIFADQPWIEYFATQTLLIIPVLFLVCFFLLASSVPVSGLSLVLALLLTCLGTYWLHRPPMTSALVAASLLFLGTFFIVSLVATYFADYFWDSRVYHGPGILYLAGGWNPVYDWQCCKGVEQVVDTGRYVESYPKSTWLVAAAIFSLTGIIETAFVANVVLLGAAFFSALAYFRTLPDMSQAWRVVLAAIAALNPIALSQLFSHYVDGALASALCALLFLLLAYLRSGNYRLLIIACLVIPFLVSVKFTGLVYAAVLGLTVLVVALALYRANAKQLLFATVPAAIVGILLTGLNPYVTNTIRHDNPFYPAVQKNKENVIYGQVVNVFGKQSRAFIERDRVSKMFITTFSRIDESTGRPVLAWPFTTYKPHTTLDARIAGFGPLFSGITVLTILLLAFVRDKLTWIVLAGLIVSVFITDASWWARLVPQAWLIPVFIIANTVRTRVTVARYTSYITLAAMLLNGMLVSTIWLYQLGFSKEARSIANMDIVSYKRHDNLLYFYSENRLRQILPDVRPAKICDGKYRQTSPYEGLLLCQHPG